MKHYQKPIFGKNHQQIVLHVGTNNLRDQEPNMVSEAILDLARSVESETNTKIILSELDTRSDNVPYDLVKTVSKMLEKYCNQNNWKLVRHLNVTKNGPKKSGFHLYASSNNLSFNSFPNCSNPHHLI